MAFARFPQLPKELRLAIWEECLPHRVVELDWPYKLDLGISSRLDQVENPDMCRPLFTSIINARPPVISRVCQESRTVALEKGGILDMYALAGWTTGTSMKPWFNPTCDILHINWDHSFDIGMFGSGDPFPGFLAAAAAPGTSFNMPNLWDLSLVAGNGRMHFELLADGRDYLVCAQIVCIHASEQAGLDSGLFGLLGDERIVLVDVEDGARVRQYRDFWAAHGSRDDLHTRNFFLKYTGNPERERLAKETVLEYRVSWLLQQWRWTKNVAIEDREGVWARQTHFYEDYKRGLRTWEQWIPNADHPWVKQATKLRPEIRLTFMFRLCTAGCTKEEEEE